jgi:hypothetical protein
MAEKDRIANLKSSRMIIYTTERSYTMRKHATIKLTQKQARGLSSLKKKVEDNPEPQGVILGQVWLHGEDAPIIEVGWVQPTLIPKLMALLGLPDDVEMDEVLDMIEMYYGEEGLSIYNDYSHYGCTMQECFNQVVKLLS